MLNEQWKPIAGFEDSYEVSNMGRVRSLPRTAPTLNRRKYPCARHEKGRILKPRSCKRYLYVSLRKNGETHTCLVHRLVATAFLENPENKPEVNHIHQPKTNNAVTNLEWATKPENEAHAKANGLHAQGSAHGMAKLTESQVIEIRKLHHQGWTQRELASLFNTHPANVGRIVGGELWKHVPLAQTTDTLPVAA